MSDKGSDPVKDLRALPTTFDKAPAEISGPLWETDSRFLNPFSAPIENPTWLKIGGRPAFPRLGLITIEARPKQGKSFCAYGICIPMLSAINFDTAEPQKTPNMVIVFDAEMSKISLLPRYKAVRASIGNNADNFLIVPMLGVPMAERWGMVEDITEQYQPDIIIIDHIGKFYNDPNDQRESLRIVTFLEKIKSERTVVVISHITTGDNAKLYGAVGTKLDNEQCERYEAISAEGIYELRIKSARDTSTENAAPFHFAIKADVDGTPIGFIDASEIVRATKEKEVEAWRKDFAALFGEDKQLRSAEIIYRIKDREGLEERSAKTKIKRAKDMGVIRKISHDPRAPYELNLIGAT